MDDNRYITTEHLRVLSMQYQQELNARWNIVKPVFIREVAQTPPPRVSHIPAGEPVEILNYNLSIQGMSDVTVRWKGGDYRVEAQTSSFRKSQSRYQPVRSFNRGKLYRFKSGISSPLMNKGKVIGMVEPDDIVMFLGFKLWDRGIESGYEFEVIHEDNIGFVGEGHWPTLEELKDQ